MVAITSPSRAKPRAEARTSPSITKRAGLDAGLGQERAHGRVERAVGAPHAVTEVLEQAGQGSHAGPADGDEVDGKGLVGLAQRHFLATKGVGASEGALQSSFTGYLRRELGASWRRV